jgi:hypothetical protein
MRALILLLLISTVAMAQNNPGDQRILQALHATVAKACPTIVGVSAGPDKNDWVVFYPDHTEKMLKDSCAAPVAQAFDPSKVK